MRRGAEVIRPYHVVAGDPRHGVVRYAREMAAATASPFGDRPPASSAARLHVHFTDRLWGGDPPSAARRLCQLADQHPVTVTLHDLPQRSDGPAGHPRRAAAYAEVARAARGIVCNSRWEVDLLARLAPAAAQRSAVVPLPIAAPRRDEGGDDDSPRPRARRGGAAVGLIGFVYPGKGHAEAIAAAAQLARGRGRAVEVVALGAVSDGHDGDADQLRDEADRHGVRFQITGYLSEPELRRQARAVAVPLAAHRHISASGSIGTWLSAGRRPLVADSPYAREIDALRPGTITRYDADHLTEAVAGALADPAGTWLAPGTELRPGPGDAAAAYLEWWSRAVEW